MLRRDSDATSLATGESVSRVNSQHDPKTIQMDLMMGRETARGCRSLFRPLGSVSWIKFLFPGMAGAGRSPYNIYPQLHRIWNRRWQDLFGTLPESNKYVLYMEY